MEMLYWDRIVLDRPFVWLLCSATAIGVMKQVALLSVPAHSDFQLVVTSFPVNQFSTIYAALSFPRS
jgi:hypothetical protein